METEKRKMTLKSKKQEKEENVTKKKSYQLMAFKLIVPFLFSQF
jgi:hypothetical protein